MKHLPNLLTLGNLFCGCIAIAFALDSQPFRLQQGLDFFYDPGTEQAGWAAVFIGLAGVFDLLDGFTARALKISSPIGKDLDSLADAVSFGVAPSMILYKMLWASWMSQPNALDVSMVVIAPAFLVACFAALRLARFNVTPPQAGGGFIGLPTPAVGIFVASFPLINFYNQQVSVYLQNRFTLYTIIAVLCWLMVSNIRFFKLMPYKWAPKYIWPQLIIVAGTITAFFLVGLAALPIAFILYFLTSLVYRQPDEANA